MCTSLVFTNPFARMGISFKYQDDVPKPPSGFAMLLGFVHLCMYDLDVIFCSFVHCESIPVPLEQHCTFEQPLKLTNLF